MYLSADEFGKIFGSQMLTYFPLLDRKIDYNQMLDMQIKRGLGTKVHGGTETMTMLVKIYFPSVRPALQDVWNARDAFNRITHQIKQAWLQDGDVSGGDWRSRFLSATLKINDCINVLQREIVSAAKIHAGVKQ